MNLSIARDLIENAFETPDSVRGCLRDFAEVLLRSRDNMTLRYTGSNNDWSWCHTAMGTYYVWGGDPYHFDDCKALILEKIAQQGGEVLDHDLGSITVRWPK